MNFRGPGKDPDRKSPFPNPSFTMPQFQQQRERRIDNNHEFFGGSRGKASGSAGSVKSKMQRRQFPISSRVNSFPSVPPGVAVDSVNRMKLGKLFINPLGILERERLKNPSSAKLSTTFSNRKVSQSSPSGGRPPKKEGTTSQDLRKKLEYRRQEAEKSKAEKKSPTEDSVAKSPTRKKEAKEEKSSPKKGLITRDDDDDSSIVVQIGGTKKKMESPTAESTKPKSLMELQLTPEAFGFCSEIESEDEDVTKTKCSQALINKRSSISPSVNKSSEIGNVERLTKTGTDKVSSPSSLNSPVALKELSITATESLMKGMSALKDVIKDIKQEEGKIKRVDLSQWKNLFETNESSLTSKGKGLLPTPTYPPNSQELNHHQGSTTDNGRGGGGGGSTSSSGGVWRTYKQVESSAFDSFVALRRKKSYARRGNAASRFHNRQYDRANAQKHEHPADNDFSPIQRDCSSTEKKDAEGKEEKQMNNKNFNEKPQCREPVNPFQPSVLKPAPPSSVRSQLYEDMIFRAEELNQSTTSTPYIFRNASEIKAFAEINSPGSFIFNADCMFGNCLMPVMPRIAPPPALDRAD